MIDIKYYSYNEINGFLEPFNNPLRPLTEQEEELLLEQLVTKGRITTPLEITVDDEGKAVLDDGHHRLKLVPKALEVNPNFDADHIPVETHTPFDETEEERKLRLLGHNLGRRNLTSEEIAEYIKLKASVNNTSVKSVALEYAEENNLATSKSSLHRLANPKAADKNREQQQERDKQKPLSPVAAFLLENDMSVEPPKEKEVKAPSPEEDTLSERAKRIKEANDRRDRIRKQEQKQYLKHNPNTSYGRTEKMEADLDKLEEDIRTTGYTFYSNKEVPDNVTSSISKEQALSTVIDYLKLSIGSLILSDKESNVQSLLDLINKYDLELQYSQDSSIEKKEKV